MSEPINDNVAEISTGVPVKQGDRVLIAIVDGEPTVVSAEGAGDELGEKIEQASNQIEKASDRISSMSAAVAESAKVAADAKQGAADAAEIAGAASEAAGKANSSAAAAQSTADAASAQANATASHFWLDAAGQANVSTDAGTVETGHSVTIGSKGIIQRLDGNLMQSLTKTALSFYLGDTAKLAAQYTPDGMDVYAAGRLLSSFTGSGAVFFDGSSDSPTTANVTASFGSDGAIIGKAAASGDVYAVIENGAFSVNVKE